MIQYVTMTNALLGDQTRLWCQTCNNLPSGWSPQASLQQIKKMKNWDCIFDAKYWTAVFL